MCERSAVIRLGATLVSDEYELRVPAVDATAGAPRYVEEESAEKPRLKVRESKLRPRDHELAAKVVLPDRLARDIDRDDVLALAVKEDLAEALALRADQAFLAGAAAQAQPTGISNVVPGVAAGADVLATARALVGKIRTVAPLLNPVFRTAGWVIHPATLDELTKTAAGPPAATVDMVRNLLSHDGADGGELLGYPFVVSAAAYDGSVRKLYFSADWREAWIGIDDVVVTIDISTHVHFQTDETVIRATMAHDFVLRRPNAFTWAEHKGTAKRATARSRKSSRSSS